MQLLISVANSQFEAIYSKGYAKVLLAIVSVVPIISTSDTVEQEWG